MNKMKYREDVFPHLIDEMRLKIGVEIGVDTGLFSEHLLSKSKLEKLYCVDPWIDDFGSDYRPGYFKKEGNKRYEEAQNRLSKFGERAVLIPKMSIDASLDFKDEEIDFIYIDGDHSLSGVFEDLRAWHRKIRMGGLISGHDFKDGAGSGIKDFNGEQLPYKVKTVVDDYVARKGYKLNIIGGVVKSWYLIKDK